MDLSAFLTSLGISLEDYMDEWRPLGQESMIIEKDDCFVCEIETKKEITRSGGCSYKTISENRSEIEFYEVCLLCMTTVRFEWIINGELDESKYDENYKH
jgi:hypothetical protein